MSGAVSVPGYPTNNLVPGVFFAVDNSQADTASVARRVLIVAQMLDANVTTFTAVPGIAAISGGVSDAVWDCPAFVDTDDAFQRGVLPCPRPVLRMPLSFVVR